MEHTTTETKFRHRTDIQIRFNDVDVFGHVNNNAYFEYYDLGKEHYLSEVLHGNFRAMSVVPVIAHISVDFIHPIMFGDEIEVETAIVHIGQKSFTLLQQVKRKMDNMVLCKSETIMVCFDKETQSATDMPDWYRTAIMEYEKDSF